MSDYNSYTVPVLKNMCRERGLGPISGKKKAELIELLTKGGAGVASTVKTPSSKPASVIKQVPNPEYQACGFPEGYIAPVHINIEKGKVTTQMVCPDGTLMKNISPTICIEVPVEQPASPVATQQVMLPQPVTKPVNLPTSTVLTAAKTTPTVITPSSTVVQQQVSPSGEGAEFVEAVQANGTMLRVTPTSTVAELKAYAKLVNVKTTGVLKSDLQRALGLRVQLTNKGRKPGSSTKTPEAKAQPLILSQPPVVTNETLYVCLISESENMVYLSKDVDVPNLKTVREQAALTPEERTVDENTGDTAIDEFIRNSEAVVLPTELYEMGENTNIGELIMCK